METSSGRSSSRARRSASGPQGSQSTGLSACCRRYGEVSRARAFGMGAAYPAMARRRLPRATACASVSPP